MYEYKIVVVRAKGIEDFPSAEETINKLGAEGWDLVNSQVPDTKGFGWYQVFTFKKRAA